MSCPYAHDDAAYVLGALSAAERLDFERHLADCEPCTTSVRRLAGLPGLLRRVGADVLESPTPQDPVPDTLLPSLFREVRRSRRRRAVVAVGLAAAAVTLAAVLPLVLAQADDDGAHQTTPPATTAPLTPGASPMVPTGPGPLEASLALEPVAWGTQLDLVCTYDADPGEYGDAPPTTYVLSVRTDDGRTEQVGTWQAVVGRTMHLTAATAAERADIASVEVQTLDGRVLLRLDA